MSGIVVLLSGSGTNLQAIIDAKLPVKYVLSDKPNAYGLTRAEEAGIPTYVLSSLKRLEHKITNVCEEHKIDLILRSRGPSRTSDNGGKEITPVYTSGNKGKYLNKILVSFNEVDLTFKSLGSRPTGTQWQMGVY